MAKRHEQLDDNVPARRAAYELKFSSAIDGIAVNGVIRLDPANPEQVALFESMKVGDIRRDKMTLVVTAFTDDGDPIFEIVTAEIGGHTLKAMSVTERVEHQRSARVGHARYVTWARGRCKALLPVVSPHRSARAHRPRRRRVASSPRKARAPDKPDPEPDLVAAPLGGAAC